MYECKIVYIYIVPGNEHIISCLECNQCLSIGFILSLAENVDRITYASPHLNKNIAFVLQLTYVLDCPGKAYFRLPTPRQ